jgi:hypothetical protein
MDMVRTRAPVRAVIAALVAVLFAGACTTGSTTNAESPEPPVDVGSAATGSAPPSSTPEDQAKEALEQLVRDYYAAENAVFLDPASDPSAALDPYLRNPASAARVADVLSFRNAGHTLESSTAVVHSVDVTQLDLSTDPATATIDVCRTLSSEGADGVTGEPASFYDRGPLVWTAQDFADGWRLATYDGSSGVDTC